MTHQRSHRARRKLIRQRSALQMLAPPGGDAGRQRRRVRNRSAIHLSRRCANDDSANPPGILDRSSVAVISANLHTSDYNNRLPSFLLSIEAAPRVASPSPPPLPTVALARTVLSKSREKRNARKRRDVYRSKLTIWDKAGQRHVDLFRFRFKTAFRDNDSSRRHAAIAAIGKKRQKKKRKKKDATRKRLFSFPFFSFPFATRYHSRVYR